MQKNRPITDTLPMPVIAKIDRRGSPKVRGNQPLLIAAALFLAVLTADLALMIAAAPSLTGLALLNVSSF